MSRHVGEDAALYALGMLDEEQRREVDLHVAECTACASALGHAEATVAAMSAAQPAHALPAQFEDRLEEIMDRPGNVVPLERARRRNRWRAGLAAAVAAALIAGVIPSAYFYERDASMRSVVAMQSAAIDRLASTPHRTVAFTTVMPNADAHVMYGPDGSWYVVLVRGASRALRLAWTHDGTQTMLGTLEPTGNVAMIYLPDSHRMERLALMDGNRVVAEAQLPY
jgi:Putative zinc-finger